MSTLSLFFITGSMLLLGCASEQSEPDPEEPTLASVAEQIEQEVGEAEADSLDQCKVMPIGVKPAGGPWGYLVYSEKGTQTDKLQELVERYNELDRKRNVESDGFSTADFATEPDLTLRNGRCYGEGLYAWNPGEIREKARLD